MPSLDKDTFDGWLVVILKNISEAKARFPAEISWLVNLESAVLTKTQDPQRKMQELGLLPGAGAPGPGVPNPPDAPGGPPGPGGLPGAPPGIPPGLPPPGGGLGASPSPLPAGPLPPGLQGGGPIPTPDNLNQLGF